MNYALLVGYKGVRQREEGRDGREKRRNTVEYPLHGEQFVCVVL